MKGLLELSFPMAFGENHSLHGCPMNANSKGGRWGLHLQAPQVKAEWK